MAWPAAATSGRLRRCSVSVWCFSCRTWQRILQLRASALDGQARLDALTLKPSAWPGRMMQPMETENCCVSEVDCSCRCSPAKGLWGCWECRTASGMPITNSLSNFRLRDEQRLLDALIDQAAVALERVRLGPELDEARLAVETERLASRSAYLAVARPEDAARLDHRGGHRVARVRRSSTSPTARAELVVTIEEEAERMAQFVANLLDMIQAGGRRNPPGARAHRPGRDHRRGGAAELPGSLADHRVYIDPRTRWCPILDLDVLLFEQVLMNHLDNAAKFARPASTITFEPDASARVG